MIVLNLKINQSSSVYFKWLTSQLIQETAFNKKKLGYDFDKSFDFELDFLLRIE